MKSRSNDVLIEVDYTRDLYEMITAGNYGAGTNEKSMVNMFSLPSMPSIKPVLFSARLFTADFFDTYEEIMVKMDKAGYRLANFTELLALGENYPDLQKNYNIIALGNPYKKLFVPMLCRDFTMSRLLVVKSFLGRLKHPDDRYFGVKEIKTR